MSRRGRGSNGCLTKVAVHFFCIVYNNLESTWLAVKRIAAFLLPLRSNPQAINCIAQLDFISHPCVILGVRCMEEICAALKITSSLKASTHIVNRQMLHLYAISIQDLFTPYINELWSKGKKTLKWKSWNGYSLKLLKSSKFFSRQE